MSSQSEIAITREQFYVTASRGRRAMRLYTDDKDAIRSAIQRTDKRASAIELAEGAVDPFLKPAEPSGRSRAFIDDMAMEARFCESRHNGSLSEIPDHIIHPQPEHSYERGHTIDL